MAQNTEMCIFTQLNYIQKEVLQIKVIINTSIIVLCVGNKELSILLQCWWSEKSYWRDLTDDWQPGLPAGGEAVREKNKEAEEKCEACIQTEVITEAAVQLHAAHCF